MSRRKIAETKTGPARVKAQEPEALKPVSLLECASNEPQVPTANASLRHAIDAMIAAREAGHLGAEREKAAAQLEVLRELRGMMGA